MDAGTARELNQQIITGLHSALVCMAFVCETETWPVFVAWANQGSEEQRRHAMDPGDVTYMQRDMLTILSFLDSMEGLRNRISSETLAAAEDFFKKNGLIWASRQDGSD